MSKIVTKGDFFARASIGPECYHFSTPKNQP